MAWWSILQFTWGKWCINRKEMVCMPSWQKWSRKRLCQRVSSTNHGGGNLVSVPKIYWMLLMLQRWNYIFDMDDLIWVTQPKDVGAITNHTYGGPCDIHIPLVELGTSCFCLFLTTPIYFSGMIVEGNHVHISKFFFMVVKYI